MKRFWGQFLPHFPAQSRSVEPLLWDSSIQGAPPLGLSRFGSEKAKKLLRNMPKSCSKVAQKFCKVAQIFLRQYV